MSFLDLGTGLPLSVWRETNNGKQYPSQAVAAGVFKMNTAISTFQRLVNNLGTPKDTPELRERLHKTRQHIEQLVEDTSAKLKAASETDQHKEVSANKKIAGTKLEKDFQTVLKEFQKAQRLAAERDTREIQQQIGEVHGIFKDLAIHVHEQGVKIDDIDSNIEGSYSATGEAKCQVVEASKSQKSNSFLTCLLLVIFIVMLLIIVIIVLAV